MAEQSINKALVKAELRKCLQRSVENICNEFEDKIYNEQFQMALSDSSLRLLEHMISKLNDFASHAKRKRIGVDDVLLYFRSRPIMLSVLKEATTDQSSDEMSPGSCSILPLGDDSD